MCYSRVFGTLTAAFFLLASLLSPAKAGETESSEAFHFMKIVEVFPGSVAAPGAQFVELQMWFSGQNFVNGHSIIVYDSVGTQIASFTFPGSPFPFVSNGANQASILIGTAAAGTLFSITPDLIMGSAAITPSGGKICFDDEPFPVDCIAWGNYTGSTTNTGPPLNPSSGLVLGKSAIRRLNIAGSPTVLDDADDTNNSANDFVIGTPAPRNNAGATGTLPPSTCGNGIIEGLEGCDDNNTDPFDGCSSTCDVEPPCTKGDLNFDGGLTPSDVVLMLACVFLATGSCPDCSADVNCDVSLTPSDVVVHLNMVFLGGPAC